MLNHNVTATKKGLKAKSLKPLCAVGWVMLDSNQRPPACKAGALNQLS